MQLHSNAALRRKTQSFDLDELLANSPPWPPVNSNGQNYGEDEKEMGSSEWVDKVMVNKHDVSRVENPLGSWTADNGDLADAFYQKYLPDSSKIYPDQSYNMFMGSNQFNIASTDEMDDLDAATSDSSEPDLLWQFNHTKLTGMTNGLGAKTRKANPKQAKSPELR
jgi:kinesin family protein C2/C3